MPHHTAARADQLQRGEICIGLKLTPTTIRRPRADRSSSIGTDIALAFVTVANMPGRRQDDSSAADVFHGIVDGNGVPECAGQRLLIGTTRDRDSAEPKLVRELDAQMAETSNTQNRHHITGIAPLDAAR